MSSRSCSSIEPSSSPIDAIAINSSSVTCFCFFVPRVKRRIFTRPSRSQMIGVRRSSKK